MRFEWDEEKNRTNIRKHGIDFTDAWEMFTSPILAAVDERQNYGEDRWIGIGMLRGRVVVAVYAERGEDTVRIISIRKALKHERERYEKALRDQLGPG
ncbi:MAG: BrnT family toxin [Verrucomicrobia bacterium]|nr:BrnT family toxin [Verrucomicrobiota bacterium]